MKVMLLRDSKAQTETARPDGLRTADTLKDLTRRAETLEGLFSTCE
jgi:hypothetical protein